MRGTRKEQRLTLKDSALSTAFMAVLCACVVAVPASAQSSNSTTAPSDTASQAILGQPTAFASAQANYEFMPGGLPKHNAKAAWSKVSSRLAVDSNMAQAVASQAGAASFNRSDYRTVGYGRASPGTTNSSVLSNGRVVPARETANCHVGARVLILIHKTTGKRLEICTACSNPRLGGSPAQSIPQRPWRLGTVLPFHRQVTKPIKCPNGHKIGKLKIMLKGVVRGRTWGKVQGRMTANMKLQLRLKLKAVVKVKCAKPAPPAAAPPTNNIVINNVNQQQQNQGQNQAQQQCALAGGVWQNGSCDMSIVIMQQQCVQQGGTWNYQTQKCVFPPPPPQPTPTPTPTPSPTPTPTPPPHVEKPSATATASCPPAGGNGSGTVTVRNGSDANTDTTVTVNIDGSITTHTLSPGETQTRDFTVDTDNDVHVVVKNSHGTVIYENTFPRCEKPKTAKPTAKVATYCPPEGGEGHFTVTLGNAAGTASADVDVLVDGVKYTFTVAAGQAEQNHQFPLDTQNDVRVQVLFKGGSLLSTDVLVVKHCQPPPPLKAHGKLKKSAFVDDSPKTLTGGEFSFSVSVNGTVKFNTTNAASGSTRDLGDFNAGDVVEACETDSDGYTPVVSCISHTAVAGETFTISIVNKKVTPPPPPKPPTVTNVTQPQEVYVNETYPNFCADVTAPVGHNIKVVFGARFGVGFTKTIISTGSDRVCGTYTAPTDLPFVWTPPSWSGLSKADTWEQVHVVATDQSTGLSSTSSDNPPKDQESYVWFPILRPPANPDKSQV
jgi:hypothetical protein